MTVDEKQVVSALTDPFSGDGWETRCLHEAFDRQANLQPYAEAVRDGRRSLSYDELYRWSNQIAHRLHGEGVEAGKIVAVGREEPATQVAALLGILKAGAGFVCLDADWPEARRQNVLAQVKPICSIGEGIPSPWKAIEIDLTSLRSYEETPLEETVDARAIAYAVYTSGSTGNPKGIWMSHGSLNRFLAWMGPAWGIRKGVRLGQWVALTFDPAYVDIFGTLAWGGTVCFAGNARRIDPAATAEWIKSEHLHVLQTTPSFCREMLSNWSAELESLEWMILAGEVLPKELAQRWLQRYGNRPRLGNLYGPSEVVAATWHAVQSTERQTSIPVGRPIAGRKVFVVDENKNLCKPGMQGEIWIAGEGLMEGYLAEREAPGRGLEEDLWSHVPGGKAYRTGDLGAWRDDGLLEFHGRRDHQIKIRGFRIELGEIETVLREHPRVRDAVVVHHKQSYQDQIIAYVLPRTAPERDETSPQIWPCLEGYGLPSDSLFQETSHDKDLFGFFEQAIRHSVKGKVVLVVGTGPHALLARKCIHSGAERVYAIEMNPEFACMARSRVERLGLAGKITFIEGDLNRTELPEKADICIAGLVGTIGSRRGAASALPLIQRHLRPGAWMLPKRSITKFAAVELPENLRANLRFSQEAYGYVEQLFHSIGYPFDVQVAIDNFPPGNILSGSAVFEELDFLQLAAESQSRAELVLHRRGRMDGFLLWQELWIDAEQKFDSLTHKSSLVPVFVPAFYPARSVGPGDQIVITCTRRSCIENGFNPDYQVEGRITGCDGVVNEFRYRLPHLPRLFQGSRFYEELFEGHEATSPSAGTRLGLVESLRQWTSRMVPRYMIPSDIVVLDEFPVTSHGKIDRQELSLRPPAQTTGRPPTTSREKTLCHVITGLLGVPCMNVEESFTALGGNSILSVQLVHQARKSGLIFTLKDVFQYPTIEGLAAVADEALSPSANNIAAQSVVGLS